MDNLSFIKRIDNLGRIVIPKEIRRKLKIDSNENMEIGIINDQIMIKKNSLLEEKNKNINFLGKVLEKISNKNIIITNRDKILFSTKKELINRTVSEDLKNSIVNMGKLNREIKICDDYIINNNFIYKIIIIDSHASGIIIVEGNNVSEREQILLDLIAELITENV